MYRTLQRSQASPGTVTLCPLTSRISHIRPIFGEYFGNPLVSCTDDHAHQCRLMLGIEDTLLGMSVRSSQSPHVGLLGHGVREGRVRVWHWHAYG